MKKLFLIGLLLYFSPDIFSQETEMHTEERSSNWVKIFPTKYVRKQARKRHPAATAKVIKERGPKDETKQKDLRQIDAFEQTNNRVKRFPAKEH